MFFLSNSVSYAWSVLMPVWEWQADAPPPDALQDALASLMDVVVDAGDTAVADTAPDAETTGAEPGLPPDSSMLQAVAQALAGAVLDLNANQDMETDAEAAAPILTSQTAAPLKPTTTPTMVAATLPLPAAPKPVPKAAAPAATPPPASGHWVLSGWREHSSYSLYRNPGAERLAEQPAREDLEHVLASARQRRKPDCGQP